MNLSERTILRACAELIREQIRPDCTKFKEAINKIIQDCKSEESFQELRRIIRTNPISLSLIYQYYNEPELRAFRSQSAPKVAEGKVPIKTYLCTPAWIAEFLVQNSIGRLWVSLHPDSKLRSKMKYFIPTENSAIPDGIRLARDIKILDPACGAFNLLIPAYKLLKEIYLEEFKMQGKKNWVNRASVENLDQIDKTIWMKNLFGIDIDKNAIELGRLIVKLETNIDIDKIDSNIVCDNTIKDSQGFCDWSVDGFDIILLNPPYLDKRDYTAKFKEYLKKRFPISSRNLYTVFVQWSIERLRCGGRLAAISPQTFMFISTYKKFREFIEENCNIETLVQTGLNTFEDAVVDCAFYVLSRSDSNSKEGRGKGIYIKLTHLPDPESKEKELVRIVKEIRKKHDVEGCYIVENRFSELPNRSWVYWISKDIKRLFAKFPPLGKIAEVRQGLATTDNKKFLRRWWEIPADSIEWNCKSIADARKSKKKWFPYIKGGEYRKWFGNREYIVNWENDGAEIKQSIVDKYPYLKGKWEWVAKNTEFYFREGVTYSYLTSGKFSARLLPAGSIFDVAGSAIFADNTLTILGILNSRLAQFLLGIINPTVNFQIGDLKKLPVPISYEVTEISELVRKAIALSRKLDSFEETTPEFTTPLDPKDGYGEIKSIYEKLTSIQQKIDDITYQLYKIKKKDIKDIEKATDVSLDYEKPASEDLAYRWISFATGITFGKFDPQITYLPKTYSFLSIDDLAYLIKNILHELIPTQANNLIKLIGNVEDFIATKFFKLHYKHYRRCPLYWPIKENNKIFVLYYHSIFRDLADKYSHLSLDIDKGVNYNIKLFCNKLLYRDWIRGR